VTTAAQPASLASSRFLRGSAPHPCSHGTPSLAANGHTRRCSDTSMLLAHMASLTPSSSSSSPPHHAAAASWGGTHGEEAREGPPHVPAATSAPSPCRSDAAQCCWPEAWTWGSASLRSSPTPAHVRAAGHGHRRVGLGTGVDFHKDSMTHDTSVEVPAHHGRLLQRAHDLVHLPVLADAS
jgi:hypothetical protein